MYDVGDVVYIRDDLEDGDNYTIYVAEEMVNYAGASATITEKNVGYIDGIARFSLDIDSGHWTWTEDMLTETEPVFEPEDLTILYG